MAAAMYSMRLRRGSNVRAEWDCWVDPADGKALRAQLLEAIGRDGVADPQAVVGQFVIEHREAARRGPWRTFAAAK